MTGGEEQVDIYRSDGHVRADRRIEYDIDGIAPNGGGYNEVTEILDL